MRPFNILIFSFLLLTITSFKSGQDYEPIYIHLTGTVFDFKTNLPIKTYPIYAGRNKISDFTFSEDDLNIEGKITTNKHGQFVLNIWLDKRNPTFWLITKDYAQIKFIDLDTTRFKYNDTIDLGQIWLISYDREIKEEKYNIPEGDDEKQKDKIEKYSIADLKILFPKDSIVKRMSINSIDTTEGLITRLNYGLDKPRGAIIKSYKTLTFEINLSK